MIVIRTERIAASCWGLSDFNNRDLRRVSAGRAAVALKHHRFALAIGRSKPGYDFIGANVITGGHGKGQNQWEQSAEHNCKLAVFWNGGNGVGCRISAFCGNRANTAIP